MISDHNCTTLGNIVLQSTFNLKQPFEVNLGKLGGLTNIATLNYLGYSNIPLLRGVTIIVYLILYFSFLTFRTERQGLRK